jgi:hypothetical protein
MRYTATGRQTRQGPPWGLAPADEAGTSRRKIAVRWAVGADGGRFECAMASLPMISELHNKIILIRIAPVREPNVLQHG